MDVLHLVWTQRILLGPSSHWISVCFIYFLLVCMCMFLDILPGPVHDKPLSSHVPSPNPHQIHLNGCHQSPWYRWWVQIIVLHLMDFVLFFFTYLSLHFTFDLNFDVFLIFFLFLVPPATFLPYSLVTGFPRSKRRISFSLSISPLLPKNRHFFSIGTSSSDEDEGRGSKYDESKTPVMAVVLCLLCQCGVL